ncbi:AmmeMemoRadiSam system protein B [bacterium]|nr:AmmeMemoRadiSam system protein B [bacterium]
MSLSFKTRKPAVAGLFYPGGRTELTAELKAMFENTSSVIIQSPIYGLVAPHAGYMYSGYVAAETYQQLSECEYDTVVVISPSHRDFFHGVSVYPGDYSTPLGTVPVDRKLAEELMETTPVVIPSDLGHREEHGLEVQLPFLQYMLKDFVLLPLVMGEQDWETSAALGNALAKVLKNRRALVVASSDLSHYHHVRQANHLDHVVINDLEAFDEKRLHTDIRSHQCEACGAGAIFATMIASKQLNARHSKVLSYHTSGEVSGDYDEVVGYLSAVMFN